MPDRIDNVVQPQHKLVKDKEYRMDQTMDLDIEFVQLACLVLEGKHERARQLAARTLRALTVDRPELARRVSLILKSSKASAIRSFASTPIPVDLDTRLELLRLEQGPSLPVTPTWPKEIQSELMGVVEERVRESELICAGLTPTRSILFVGPPGVGKTLAARWLALRLQKPLLMLDLAAVMSSFLGKTGNNIRAVLNYAQQAGSILLLDEFDAIAKRRDDATEIGELKRLVTVILQSVDDWPGENLLLAATNHPDLLDPAIWRRFDKVLNFPLPSRDDLRQAMCNLLPVHSGRLLSQIDLLASLYVGRSFADLERDIRMAKRRAVMEGEDISDMLLELAATSAQQLRSSERIRVAMDLVAEGYSQRRASEMARVSRDTIRKLHRDQPSRSTGHHK